MKTIPQWIGSVAIGLCSVLLATGMAPAQGFDDQPVDLPPVDSYSFFDPNVAPANAASYDAMNANHIASLEARIAELEAKNAEGKDKKPDEGYVVGSDTAMSAKWVHGIEIQSKNKDFRVHIGGRTQIDGVGLTAPNLVLNGIGTQDAVDFRRARLRVDGQCYDIFEWAAEYDFVNSVNTNAGLVTPTQASSAGGNIVNVPAPTDLWVTFKELPVFGNIRVGNQKEPLGLEHLTSSRWLDFMERSFNQDAFTGPFNNGFTPGMAAFRWSENERWTWSYGAFKNNTNPFAYGVGDGEYALDGRVTYLPYYDEPTEGRYLVHTGLGASYRGLDNNNLRVRSRASVRNGPGALNPVFADTGFAGAVNGDTQVLLCPELAIVNGPWLFQSEYVSSFVNGVVFTPYGGAPVHYGPAYFQGGYVEALYFLTGEHRAYERHMGYFNRVVPNENSSFVRGLGWCGRGAWQVGLRYGFLDLNDRAIQGGYIQDMTLGLNWILNPNMKIQFNYVFMHVNNVQHNTTTGAVTAINDGNMNAIGVRLANDF